MRLFQGLLRVYTDRFVRQQGQLRLIRLTMLPSGISVDLSVFPRFAEVNVRKTLDDLQMAFTWRRVKRQMLHQSLSSDALGLLADLGRDAATVEVMYLAEVSMEEVEQALADGQRRVCYFAVAPLLEAVPPPFFLCVYVQWSVF